VDRYVVIDGFKRITALERLGRDTVEAVVWPMSEAAAVLLDRSLRLCEHETALEMGWLLAKMEQRFGYSLEGGALQPSATGSLLSSTEVQELTARKGEPFCS
jgi:hypothetical protein